jgi:hypothetical protein
MPVWKRALPLLALWVAACGHAPPEGVPLVQGATSYSALDAQIERRLLARWPIGVSEEGLAEFLRTQGFTVARENRYYVEARLRWGGLLYGTEAKIYWRTNSGGKITELYCNVGGAGPLARFEDL